MQNRNVGFERHWPAIGWGLFLVLVGGLVLADGRGWLDGGEGCCISRSDLGPYSSSDFSPTSLGIAPIAGARSAA